MRNLFITSFILFFTHFILAQSLEVKGGLVYNQDGGLYTGEITTNGTDGGRQSEAEIVQGKFNGEANYYYASGSLMETGFFDYGLKKWNLD